MDKQIILTELARVRKRIKLINNFKSYGDTLNNTREEDALEALSLNAKQKQLVARLKTNAHVSIADQSDH